MFQCKIPSIVTNTFTSQESAHKKILSSSYIIIWKPWFAWWLIITSPHSMAHSSFYGMPNILELRHSCLLAKTHEICLGGSIYGMFMFDSCKAWNVWYTGLSNLWDAESVGTIHYSCLLVATHETSSTMRAATRVTFQHPEILRLPRKAALQHHHMLRVPQKVTLHHHDGNVAPATTSRTTICYRQITWSVIYNM